MDLEDFGDSTDVNSRDLHPKSQLSAHEALCVLDRTWYTPATRRARWMDLLGDFAGKEHFAIDGDALLQVILDDPLLALGVDGDFSFPIIHAMYSLETMLNRFLQRQTSPDILFFDSNKYATIGIGSSASPSTYAIASRALARSILLKHLQAICSQHELGVFAFTSTDDPSWNQYISSAKPMFIMTNDGGSAPKQSATNAQTQTVLLQRLFLSWFLTRGIAVVLLKGCEFRGSKILSFVYDSGRKCPVKFSQQLIDKFRVDLDRHPVCEALVASSPSAPAAPTATLQNTDISATLLEVCSSYLEDTPSEARSLELLYVFVIHALTLQDLPLQTRAQEIQLADAPALQLILEPFIDRLLISLLKASSPSESSSSVLYDGRLFIVMLHVILESDVDELSSFVGSTYVSTAQTIWTNLALALPPFDIQALHAQLKSHRPILLQESLSLTAGSPPPTQPTDHRPLLPFSNPVFDSHLVAIDAHVQSTTDTAKGSAESWDLASSKRQHLDFGQGAGTIFVDAVHWHNSKKAILPEYLGGSKDRRAPTTSSSRGATRGGALATRGRGGHRGGGKTGPNAENKWTMSSERYFALRSHQQFMARLQDQAGNLTGALGASLVRVIIPPSVADLGRAGKPSGMKKLSSGSGSRPLALEAASKKQRASVKQPPVSSADKLRQKIAAEKQKDQSTKSDSWWKGHIEKLQSIDGFRSKHQYMENILRSKNASASDPAVVAEMLLFRVDLCLRQWVNDEQREKEDVGDAYRVEIMRRLKDLLELSVPGAIGQALYKHAISSLRMLGFEGYADEVKARHSESSSKDVDRESGKLSFKFIKLSSRDLGDLDFMKIKEDPIGWQLRCFGEHMDRSMDSQQDPRVTFRPDAWQRKVLDSIDADESLLVVAPTSAGKTFISFYAMEKVLRGSNDGILVYICPTKALVQQVAAEVYARFSKELKDGSFWAIHTRDYRINNPQKCQILITVPEVLSIMLLSPPLAHTWTPRLKRIILDEIHTIGQLEQGTVWEQILLLASCPIIGLSATIGSPERFNGWLRAVQTSHGNQHRYIEHPFRYSHLRKHFYDFDEHSRPFDGIHSGTDLARRCKFVHPVSMLSFGPRSLPADLSLEAADTRSLYNAMVSSGALTHEEVDSLDPHKFFNDRHLLLTQRDVISYEHALKDKLVRLLETQDVRDQNSALYKVVHRLQHVAFSSSSDVERHNSPPSEESFLGSMIHLATELHVHDELPAIFFNFDRTECERIASELLEELSTAETRWKETSGEWKRKLASWEKWKLQERDRRKEADKSRTRTVKKKQGDDTEGPTRDEEPVSANATWYASFDPDAVLPDFSFAGVSTGVDMEELEKELAHLLRRKHIEPWISDALLRGIGIHHAGMNKDYRGLIESLFRKRFVRIMIATGTLALGINAPTKTAVFCGDSPFLTALMYRQCAGRAGRRGFDLLGKVVFYGLPLERVQRLVTSKLPSLAGNFPLTSTLALRLLNLLQGSDNSEVASKAIKSILSLAQVGFDSTTGNNELLHHLRFSIEYLRRSRLIDETGNAYNLFGMAAHLYYQEPSNFALVALLRSGALHKIAIDEVPAEAKKQLMLVLAHLFGRRYLVPSFTNKHNIEQLSRKYPSMIVLPPLPDHVRSDLVKHDAEILRIFSSYAMDCSRRYVQRHDGSKDTLPLSGIEYPGRTEKENMSPFHQLVQNNAIPVVARSPFIATSGHGDHFSSVSELARSVRQGIDVNEYMIPSLEQITAIPNSPDSPSSSCILPTSPVDNAALPLNAYILDFYIHGQVATLANANGIRRGDVWYLLQDFDLTLATIKASMEYLFQQVESARKRKEPAPIAATTSSKRKSTKTCWESDSGESDVREEWASGIGSPVALESVALTSTAVSGEDQESTMGTTLVDGEEYDELRVEGKIARPEGVGDSDWRLYKVLSEVAAEFRTKFKGMWA